ncbi:MAG TPA: DUF1800 domain-containing protein [Acidobacteriota bacterium]|nr:DUF1800 domain-containing protein [Acidobacteriota bacterium]
MYRHQIRGLAWLAAAILVVAGASMQDARAAVRDFVQPGDYAARPGAPLAPQTPTTVDPQKVLAGHLLRRLGFGPSKKEIKKVLKMGYNSYIDKQLNPNSIDDSKAFGKLPRVPNDFYDDYTLIRRWYIRMVWTQRLLQEKMTLIWHEHFSTSNQKVRAAGFMQDHEDLMRRYALGDFRSFLIDMTKDQAMLIWLDNNYNDGNATDDQGNPLPPNENFAREFMQLFTMGTKTLNIDGTPKLNGSGDPYPPYAETDVREVARALTGWYAPWPYKHNNSQFGPQWHDEGNKTILGTTLIGRTGNDGANEVGDVVNIILNGDPDRTNTVAAFISKELIMKLATETPSPAYVQAVATAFRDSNWSIKAAVEAILKNPYFTDPTVVRNQYKEPIEQYIGMIRALAGKTKGEELVGWTSDSAQLVYYPPSVFSFYPPGNKGALITTATVFIRDRIADEYARGWSNTFFNPSKLIGKYDLTTPTAVADFLEDKMLAAPMATATRDEIINYMQGTVDEDNLRGAIWLLLCSPDFQRN